MGTFTVGYFVGSLAKASINRKLAQALVRLAPPSLALTEIPFAALPRLQTIVSREVAAAEAAVVTIGALQAGTKENVIPDDAIIKLNVGTFDEGVRTRVLAAIERIVNAEAEASGAPRKPEITTLDRYPLNVNDPGGKPASGRGVQRSFRRRACS